MKLSYKPNHKDNKYSIEVFVSQKGTTSLTEEEEKDILENYNRSIQFKNIVFEGYYDVQNKKIIRVPKAEESQDQTGIKVTLNLVNKKILINHDLNEYFEISLNQIKDSEVTDRYTKDQVAEMSAFIAKEADNQDKQAMDILIKAGQDLGQQALHLMHKLAVKEDIKIAVTGSVLTQNNLVFHAFQQEVLKGYENTHFIREERSNTIGAYYYFKK